MNLFTQIDEFMRVHLHGWCSIPKAEAMASSVLAIRPETVVEVGVWTGKSCVPLALSCAYNHFGKVVAIDPWSHDASVTGQTGANLDWWNSVNHDEIYNIFISEINRLNLNAYVQVNRAKSDDVEPPPNIGVLHIDGNHSEQAIRDVERYAPNVILGGFTFCDDIHWDGGGVNIAVQRLTKLGFKHLYDIGDGGMFQRTELR